MQTLLEQEFQKKAAEFFVTSGIVNVKNDRHLGGITIIDANSEQGHEIELGAASHASVIYAYPDRVNSRTDTRYTFTRYGNFEIHANLFASELCQAANEIEQPLLLNKNFWLPLFAIAHANEENPFAITEDFVINAAQEILIKNSLKEGSAEDLALQNQILKLFTELTVDEKTEIMQCIDEMLVGYQAIHALRFIANFREFPNKVLEMPSEFIDDTSEEEQRERYFSFIWNNRSEKQQGETLAHMMENADTMDSFKKLIAMINGANIDQDRVHSTPLHSTIAVDSEPSDGLFDSMLDTLENAIEHNEFILSIFKAIAGEEKVKLTRVTLFAIRAINEALKEGHSIDEIPLPVEVVEAIQNFAKMVMLRAKKKRITAGLPLWIDKLTILVDDND